MKSHLKTLVAGILCTVLVSCGTKQDQPAEEHAELHVSGDTVTLTPAQRSRLRLTTGAVSEQDVTSDLVVTGKIDVPPQNVARIGAPMGGVVRTIKFLPGSHVRRGQVLVTLEDASYVNLQRDYLVTASRIDVLEKELQRQQELAKEQINPGKVLEQVAGEVRALRIQRKSLEEQLALLQINARTLSEENISRTISLKSPIDGYVTGIYAVTGSYHSPNDSLMDVVSLDHLHAEMSVFERDVTSIKEGQRFTATLNDARKTVITGKVHLVGKGVEIGRTVVVHGHLDRNDKTLLPGTTFTSTISADPRKALVVPTAALISDTEGTWIYAEISAQTFIRYKVERGSTQNGVTELRDAPEDLRGRSVVLRGAAMLNGTFNKGEDHH